MASTISSRACSSRLTTLAEILRLAAEGTLINPPLLSSREWQTHVLKLEDSLGPHRTHVLDGILIAYVVRALDRVVHVPPPVVIGVGACDSAGDAALCRHCV